MRMVVNGIEVSVTKKAIKNMHLYVKPPDGHVEVLLVFAFWGLFIY